MKYTVIVRDGAGREMEAVTDAQPLNLLYSQPDRAFLAESVDEAVRVLHGGHPHGPWPQKEMA